MLPHALARFPHVGRGGYNTDSNGWEYHLLVYHCLEVAAVVVRREKTSEPGFAGLGDYRDWKNVAEVENCRIGEVANEKCRDVQLNVLTGHRQANMIVRSQCGNRDGKYCIPYEGYCIS
jgi:hypothetical protein